MKISQDTKILQNFLSNFKDGQGNITLNFIENLVVGDETVIGDSDSGTTALPAPKDRCALPRLEIPPKQLQYFPEIPDKARRVLHDFIGQLPEPRINTLMYWVFKVCVDNNMTRQETADWLGMTFTTASNWFRRFNLKPRREARRKKC